MTFPNLAGIATKDLVETIGAGSFKASYINWSRTLQLLRQHAPGWLAETVPAADGSLIHRAPVGGYLMIRFVHVDGQVTPAVPQAIMDHKNQAVPYDRITARDVSDTQRRGTCLAAAYFFGLAAELWAKMPLESGWGTEEPEEAPKAPSKASTSVSRAPKEPVATQESTEASFRATAAEKGLSEHAIEGLLGVIKGDYAKGVATLAKKSAADVKKLNAQYAPKEPEPTEAEDLEQW